MSSKARVAMDAVEHYPYGDVREWAERNWNEAVRPFMDEFIAAVKNKSALVAEEYFDGTSPAFLFSDVKAMHGMSIGMRDKTPRDKAEIMSRVFFPFGQKWTELLTAIHRRIGACAEVRTFKTKLALVADSIKLMFAESGLEAHAGTVFDLRRGMIEAFGALRDRVCSMAPADLPRRTHRRYCLSNADLAELFGVKIKTITRWKNEANQSEDARKFRLARESERYMRAAADQYKQKRRANGSRREGGRVGFCDAIDYGSHRIDR